MRIEFEYVPSRIALSACSASKRIFSFNREIKSLFSLVSEIFLMRNELKSKAF